MNQQATITIDNKIDRIVEMVRQLSLRDRLKLISAITPETDKEIANNITNKESLYGLWKHFNLELKSEDIDEARNEIWSNFPRTDTI